ncbi:MULTISPECIES: hypothetical protein [unclassified Pseudomonas]|uniref:hypothetical protein n=1 Tax=unclassified Pseudomonas TaxID=196821 RepID=UPI001A9314DF|nr:MULTISPECIES: hypothetical protein [unclassified Pseudomonas]
MVGQRTRYSLAQFLALQDVSVAIVLLGKYGVQDHYLYPGQLLIGLAQTLAGLDDRITLLILQEIVGTQGNLRAAVTPKTRFDERMHDLTQCLLLDGYIVQDKRLLQTDPSITDAPPVDDDLIIALRNSGAPTREAIITKINDLGRGVPRLAARLQRRADQRPDRLGNAGGRCRRGCRLPASIKRQLQPSEMG